MQTRTTRPTTRPTMHPTSRCGHAVIDRLLSGGLAESDLTIAGTGGPHGDGALRRFGWSLRERVQAMSGLGLSSAAGPGAPPRRGLLPGDGAGPDIGYLGAGDRGGRAVLFIHGTPGAAADWTPFLARVPDGQNRIAIDRPGFGRSGPAAPLTGLADQARAIARLIAAGQGPAVLVGSSYGGPVALQLAAAHPDLVAGVLVVGSAGDPALEAPHPLQRLAAARGLRRLLPRALRHANAELLALGDELEQLGRRLRRIRAPVTVLQGLQDTLVPAANAPYLAERLEAARRRRVILVEREGHFLHILRPRLVESALSQLIAAT